jgi:undecaprenyl-diphosphatase
MQADKAILLWLNGWVGRLPWLDAVVRLVVGDYLVPVLLALALLWLWFSGANATIRERNQRAVMTALMGLGLANLAVEALNQFLFRPRPFMDLQVTLLFYRPTDSSFPANPAAIAFAVATGVWLWNRRVGTSLAVIGTLFALARMYAGVSYPLDGIGGAAIGTAASLVAIGLLRLSEPLPTLALRLGRAIYLA